MCWGGGNKDWSLAASLVTLTGLSVRMQCDVVDVRVWTPKLARPGPSPAAATPTSGPTRCSGRDQWVSPALIWMQ